MHLEWPDTVAHRIDQVIAEHPDNIAIKDGFGRCWTYAVLEEQVDSIARVLCDLLPDQTRQGAVVGVFQTPAAGWIASLVAIMRVGAVYLPLDLKVSASRLNSYVKAAQPAVILTDDTMVGLTEDIGIEHPTAVVNISGLPAAVPGSNSERIKTAAQSQSPAYIIFTSGSTGTPKGVVVKHASFRAMAEGYVRQWDTTATVGGVVLQQFPLTSDGSLKQIVSAITTGGCLVVASVHARGDPVELTQLMAEEGVTCAVATPSEWSMWFRFASDGLARCTALTSAWFGGEKAPQSLLDSFRGLGQTLPKLRFFHTYGPTEATISTAKGEALLRQDSELAVPVPLHTLPNYTVYIVDEELQPVPVGVPGEIIIGGAGVGDNEYLGRPDLTADRFLADPFALHDSKPASGWGRMYRTGDYGRLDAHGRLIVEGRIAGDAQVKIRGFRVELGEIEGVILKEAAGALSAAVLTLRDGEGDDDGFLVAHVVMQESNSKTALAVAGVLDQLRTRLALSLPQYMIPAVLVPVDEIPLTAHGKVDRNAVRNLALPEAFLPTGQPEEEGLLTAAERRLANTWATLLPPYALAAERLTRRTDFFRAGGNSLLLVKLQAAIKSTFGGEAPRLSKLMGAPELGSMATLLMPLLESSGGGAAGPDWDEEMALDFDLADIVPPQQRHQNTANGLCVLVTGATGLLGKNIMPLLVADARIAQIIVLARHADGRDLTRLFPNISDANNKIRVIATELPAIPTPTEAPELQSLDVILHVAADRNFWDGYAALKPVNVDAVKGLARLALHTGSALHVLSSGAVANYEADADHRQQQQQHSGKLEHEEEEGGGAPARPDPALGYVASKWTAERYLANAARQAGLRVTAHRPTAMATTTAQKTPPPESMAVVENKVAAENNLPTEMEAALARSILATAPQLGVRPDFNHISGTLHVAPVGEVAAAVVDAVARTGSGRDWEECEVRAMRIVNHPATASVRTEVVAVGVEKALEEDGNQGVLGLPSVPALQWVGMAKRAGVFKWFFAAQELVVTDDEGRTVVSKR
jgi:hybrid polyketide synthase/nonribosomal peptide synthetase ACE1